MSRLPHQAIAGMKGYNGVAILSRRSLAEVRIEPWCGRDDCRHIHAQVEAGTGPIEVHSL